MTDAKDPGKPIEGAVQAEDDEILELNEEVIDLSQDDEGILELKEEVVDAPQDDDEVVHLLESVEELPMEDSQDRVDESAISQEEEIVDLTEAIESEPQEIEEIGAPIYDAEEAFPDTDDHLGVTEEPLKEADEGLAMDLAIENDFVDSMGVELDSEKDVSEDFPGIGDVSDEQIDAALERVIKKMFHEKIDHLLVEVIEKTVKKEIERLKGILLEDSTDNEK